MYECGFVVEVDTTSSRDIFEIIKLIVITVFLIVLIEVKLFELLNKSVKTRS
jgi:hypothetical protein